MSRYTPVDLSSLPAPEVIEMIDYEVILAAMETDLKARWPEFTATVESEPARKILQVAALRETLLRQRVNDAARSVMLAYAGGGNLDHLAALLGTARRVDESDEELRRRAQLSPEGWSTAGPAGAYELHARLVSAKVKDVLVTSPEAGEVLVTVLGDDGDGTPDASTLAAVRAALNAETVRPICDAVTVQAAEIVTYQVVARITIGGGPDAEAVRAASEASVRAYAKAAHRLGAPVPLSGLYAVLHVAGVERATLTSPAADVAATAAQAPYCETVTVTTGA